VDIGKAADTPSAARRLPSLSAMPWRLDQRGRHRVGDDLRRGGQRYGVGRWQSQYFPSRRPETGLLDGSDPSTLGHGGDVTVNIYRRTTRSLPIIGDVDITAAKRPTLTLDVGSDVSITADRNRPISRRHSDRGNIGRVRRVSIAGVTTVSLTVEVNGTVSLDAAARSSHGDSITSAIPASMHGELSGTGEKNLAGQLQYREHHGWDSRFRFLLLRLTTHGRHQCGEEHDERLSFAGNTTIRWRNPTRST